MALSLLETLLIKITLDATDVKKGADDVQKSSSKIDRSFDNTSRHSEHLAHSFHHIKRELTGLVFSMIGVGAVVEGIKSSFEYAKKVSESSNALKVNVEQLDAWNNAIKKSGGTAEGFQNSLRGVAKHFNTSNETALKILPQLSDVFHKLSNSSAQKYGKAIGLDESTILLLQRGRREVDSIISRQKELGVVTKKDKEIIDKFNDAWGDTEQQFRKIALESELGIIPIFTKIVSSIGELISYLSKHSGFIKSSLIGIGIAAAFFGREMIFAAAKAVLAWGKILGPIGVVGAAIGILYDDWQAFKRGDESVTGEIMKSWPAMGKVIVFVGNVVEHAIKNWIKYLKSFLHFIGKAINILAKVRPDKDSFNSAYDPRILGIVNHTIKQADNNKLNSLTSSSIANGSGYGIFKPQAKKTTNVHIGNITINTQSTDAESIRDVFSKTLQDHIFQANSNFDDGQLI